MKVTLFILTLVIILSCHNNKEKNNTLIDKAVKDTTDYRKITDNFYDIADLTTYKDTSKFIARLRYEPPFSTTSIVELDEIANGINLCVKQPKVKLPYGDTLKGNRSLAFNQLCYWYADKEAQDIKALFSQFNTGQRKIDNHCKSCLDQPNWEIEIYDHGKYSLLKQDFVSQNDWAFTELILEKVDLSKQNGYAIKY